jgi:hypothetical protein
VGKAFHFANFCQGIFNGMKYVRIEGSRKLGSFIEPMKAQISDRPAFDSEDWLFEIKWDGYRAIAEINAPNTGSIPGTAIHSTKHIQKFFLPYHPSKATLL